MKLAILPLLFSVLHTSIATNFFERNTVEANKAQDVYAPPVIRPAIGEIAVVGEPFLVVWDASTPPGQITNPFGVIRLRKGNSTMSSNLARGFSILQGSMQIIIPNVVESDDYRIVLFGDSGNWSEEFRIVARIVPPAPCYLPS
ncbi:hypothetical protein BKA70DRAFT_653022 [Coprinopsis sp. MPI-PUGE-AT-0042]|nr:hypothetical protein BKA70DRAFT_653022 [Coprinopsis sp. MPI-PUGE-AT-0042]